MSLPWTIALVTAATAASTAIGYLASGSLLGAAAGIPTAIVGVWQAWRHHQHAERLETRLKNLEPDVLAQLSRFSNTWD